MRHDILTAAVVILAAAPLQAQELPPASPTDLTAEFSVSAGKGSVKGHLTAPTMSNDYIDPQPLTGRISRIVVTRSCWMLGEWDVEVARFEQAVPGRGYSFTDDSLPAYGYDYTYTAVAANADGAGGYGTSAYVFAGVRPASPEFVSVASLDHGQPPLTFVIKASGLTDSGTPMDIPLTSLTLSYMMDDDDETIGTVQVIDNPEADREYTVEFDAKEGTSYIFRLVSACGFGESESSTCTVYVGEDSPGSPADVTATPRDGGVEVVWTAPTRGRHNGWIDTAATRYRVERHEGSAATLIADNLADCGIYDSCDDLVSLTAVRYSVTAMNDIGESIAEFSETLTVGPSARLPFIEHFNRKTMYSVEAENLWSYDPEGWTGNWNLTCYSYASGGATGVLGDESNDEGYAYCSHSYSRGETHDSMISSPIDMTDAVYPVVSFWYLARTGMDNRLEVACDVDGEMKPLMDFCISDDTEEGDDLVWRRRYAAMPEAAGCTARLVMHAYRMEEGEYTALCIDEIMIDDYPPVSGISASSDGMTTVLSWTAPESSSGRADSYEVTVDDASPVRVSGTSMDVVLDDDDDHHVAVRAIYGDIPSCLSEEYVFSRLSTGVTQVTVTGARTEYLDINGMPCPNPLPGSVVIRRTVNPDGSVSVSKAVVGK